MTQESGLFEAMHSQRAIRYLKPDPVPDELIRKLLEAAIRAPNGANRQEWSFVVVRDPQTRKKIADLYLDAVVSQKSPDLAPDQEKIYTATKHLADHLHEVPVFIFPCHTHGVLLSRPAMGVLYIPRRPEHTPGRARPGAGERAHHPPQVLREGN